MQLTATKRVIVVDDTDAFRVLLRVFLNRSSDFEVVGEACNGVEAIELAGEVKPELVMLDIAMPIMDGLEAIPLILEVSPESVIVMMSGFNAEQVAEEAFALGASAYIEKGTPPDVILSRLRQVVCSSGGSTP